MISLYLDIMISLKEVLFLSDRTKQVQFRMPDDVHKELKILLIKNDSSLTDFFNEVAVEYLNAQKNKSIVINSEKINGGENND